MSIEAIPARCRTCPNIYPLVRMVCQLELLDVTPDVQAHLREQNNLPEHVITEAAESSRYAIEVAVKALTDQQARTVGCPGVKLPDAPEQPFVCRSVFTQIGPNKTA